MRILVLSYEFPPLGGGGSPVVYNITKGYADRGHQVDVVTMHYKNLPYKERINGVTVYRVPSLRRKKEVCSIFETFSYVLSALWFLRKHLKTHSYDINHTHFIVPTGCVSLMLKFFYKIPFIVTAHGSDVPGYNTDRFVFGHLFTRPFQWVVCELAARITSPSYFLLRLIKKRLGDYSEKWTVIPNGMNIHQYQPAEKKNIILSHGRLLPRKGFHDLIKAVYTGYPGFQLHICGAGPAMPRLRKLAAQSRTPVVLHGWVDSTSDRFRDLIGSAAIYCLASSKENASMALLEAMSAGCAVITTNVSGCPETIGDAGMTVPAHDPAAISTVISKLVGDPGLIQSYQQKARKRLVDVFDQEKITNQYVGLLKNVLMEARTE